MTDFIVLTWLELIYRVFMKFFENQYSPPTTFKAKVENITDKNLISPLSLVSWNYLHVLCEIIKLNKILVAC